MTTDSIAVTVPWYRAVTAQQWRALAAAKLGWMLDAMDFLLYVMAIGQLKEYFGFNDATAGMLGTVTLVTSAVGGIVFGVVADRADGGAALIAIDGQPPRPYRVGATLEGGVVLQAVQRRSVRLAPAGSGESFELSLPEPPATS